MYTLDFPGSAVAEGVWFKGIYIEAGGAHKLIYPDTDDVVCRAQIEARRVQQPHRAATDAEAMFAIMAQYFEPSGWP